ncbi:FG-GAP repeat protein [Candidatus Sumerlaeota bacterium]|nr:FG-GAP repeat protein [Candidatus Sumerlaeota bacterium]
MKRFSISLLIAFAVITQAVSLPPVLDLNVEPGEEASPTLRIHGEHWGDHLGEALALGDLDGDGLADLVIGAPLADPEGRADAGEVEVVWGSRDLPGNSLYLSGEPDERVARFPGQRVMAQMGSAVACGDLNGDGFDDLIAGVRLGGVAGAGRSEPGKVVVFWGGPDLRRSGPSQPDLTLLAEEPGAQLGWSLAVGDLNGDGTDDLAMGAVTADSPGGVINAGAIAMLFGGEHLSTGVISLPASPEDARFTWITGDDPGDQMGFALACGDVDGDGFDDLVAGTPGGQGVGNRGARIGEVIVLFGAPDLSGQRISLDTDDSISGVGETRILGDDVEDQMGRGVACGDIDGDGIDDVVVGVPFGDGDLNANWDVGEALVIFGGEAIRGQFIDLNTDGEISEIMEARLHGEEMQAAAGWSVATGDIDGDGFSDVILGSRWADSPGRRDAGAIWALPGGNDLRGANLPVTEAWTSLHVLGDNLRDGLGYTVVSGGDINGDGWPEIAVAAPLADNPQIDETRSNESGEVFVVFGGGDAEGATVIERIREGDNARHGMGGRLSPVIRAWLSLEGGEGDRVVTATLIRGDAAVQGLGDVSGEGVADVVWHFHAPAGTLATAEITLRFLESETLGVRESLRLFRGDTLGGPWAEIGEAQFDMPGNTVTAQVDTLGHFALATSCPASGERGGPRP